MRGRLFILNDLRHILEKRNCCALAIFWQNGICGKIVTKIQSSLSLSISLFASETTGTEESVARNAVVFRQTIAISYELFYL
jgi:hypothetical protein